MTVLVVAALATSAAMGCTGNRRRDAAFATAAVWFAAAAIEATTDDSPSSDSEPSSAQCSGHARTAYDEQGALWVTCD